MDQTPLPTSSQKDPLTWRFPEIEPFATGRLAVSDVHSMYYEESGNPEGLPVCVLHGGPGGGSTPLYREFFDPQKYRIIQHDQRGAGRSTPHATLEDNTTWHLVSDIEKLREHLKIKQWHVFGGSWGSTLSLAYSETHPDRVLSITLRGIFLIRQKELDWFYEDKGGALQIFPDAWEEYSAAIPASELEGSTFIEAYYKRLTSPDKAVRLAAATAWSKWEGATSMLFTEDLSKFEDPVFAEAFARIECHYFRNGAFFERDGWLIEQEQLDKLRSIPISIVQGRYDIVCPIDSAWQLHKRLPHADFVILPKAGHSAKEVSISRALVAATDKYSYLGSGN